MCFRVVVSVCCNCRSYEQETLLVVRFFLGLAEAPFFPGAVFCMLIMRRSLWFKGNTDLCV